MGCQMCNFYLMHLRALLLCAAFSTILFAGCLAAENGPIKFREAGGGPNGGTKDPAQVAIQSQSEWDAFAKKYGARSGLKPDAVDFQKETLLVVTAGSKPTGGYGIR